MGIIKDNTLTPEIPLCTSVTAGMPDPLHFHSAKPVFLLSSGVLMGSGKWCFPPHDPVKKKNNRNQNALFVNYFLQRVWNTVETVFINFKQNDRNGNTSAHSKES